MLKNNGYNVKVINLLEMDKSDCYNPFSYIREETDVVKLITNLISNTTPKGATPSDPFWEKAEGLFLQSIENKAEKVEAEIVYAPMVAESHEYQYNADAFEAIDGADMKVEAAKEVPMVRTDKAR